MNVIDAAKIYSFNQSDNSTLTFTLPTNTNAIIICNHPWDEYGRGAWFVYSGYTTNSCCIMQLVTPQRISVSKTADTTVKLTFQKGAVATIICHDMTVI